MKSDENKPRTCVYWSTEADKDAFERDARKAGVRPSAFGRALLEARRSGPALLLAVRYIDPEFHAKLVSGQGGAGLSDTMLQEANQRADAAERRIAQLIAERDRLNAEIRGQATTIGNLQNALRTAEERASQVRLGEANLAALRDAQEAGTAPPGVIGADARPVLAALRSGRLYEEELLDTLEAQNGWTRERARAELAHALGMGIIPQKGPDGRFGKPSPLPADFLRPKGSRSKVAG